MAGLRTPSWFCLTFLVACSYDFGAFGDGDDQGGQGGAPIATSQTGSSSSSSATSSSTGNLGGNGGLGGGGAPPIPCGNGILDAGEACDDTLEGDIKLCNQCQVVCAESEVDGRIQFFDASSKHCYLLHTQTDSTVPAATQLCTNWRARGYLAGIQDQPEQTLVESKIESDTYLGGSDSDLDGTWTWATLEPFGFTRWGGGEPGQNEYCMYMRQNGEWEGREATCSIARDSLCEWEPKKAP